MFPDILNIAVAGLIAGIIFSMPVAGPISILITSSALKGKLRFCKRAAIGASLIEFIYVFIVIIGIKSLYSLYQPFIPYLILVGSLFLIFASVKIIKTDLSFNDFDKGNDLNNTDDNKGGLRAGVLLNLTNPSLFIGWLASSFLVFSIMNQMGISNGGLDMIIHENINSVSEIVGDDFSQLNSIDTEVLGDITKSEINNKISPVVMALTYSSMVALGGFLWLFNFSKLLIKYREKIRLSIVNIIIKLLGVALLGMAFFLVYKSIGMF